jgi:hypothetical protein
MSRRIMFVVNHCIQGVSGCTRANCDADHAGSFDVFDSPVPNNSIAPANLTARVFPFRESNSTKSS